ncbi:MAG TPA: hypothetical protein P5510_11590 [Clostridia bacterium]|jgi:hypothetical protein|nr:hypothetical protein [Bacillota bacterium]HRS22399.1 hypothetical protein [Clostridia bacterium]
MKLIEEHDTHIVVECEHVSNISGKIDERYISIQKRIDDALGVKTKRSSPGCMIFVYGLIIAFIVSIAFDILFGVLMVISSLITGLIVDYREKRAAAVKRHIEKEKAINEYNAIKARIHIPENSSIVTFIGGNINLRKFTGGSRFRRCCCRGCRSNYTEPQRQ